MKPRPLPQVKFPLAAKQTWQEDMGSGDLQPGLKKPLGARGCLPGPPSTCVFMETGLYFFLTGASCNSEKDRNIVSMLIKETGLEPPPPEQRIADKAPKEEGKSQDWN